MTPPPSPARRSPAASTPVPELLQGVWKRAWIRTADGEVDDTTLVIWLQLASKMVDVRIGAQQRALAHRGALGGCSIAELTILAESESSSGITTCTPVEVGDDGLRRATAEWITRNSGDVAFQPVTAYPEPGLLEWNDDGSVMIERAPSGAYVEEWHRAPNTDTPGVHLTLADGRQWYCCGDIGVLVRDRPKRLSRAARLQHLIDELGDDHAAIAALVDCEFSIAERVDRGFFITASTLPWLVGNQVEDLVDADL